MEVPARQGAHRPSPPHGLVPLGGVGVTEGEVRARNVVPALRDRQRALELGQRQLLLLNFDSRARVGVGKQIHHVGLVPPAGPHRKKAVVVSLLAQQVKERRWRKRDVTAARWEHGVDEDGTDDPTLHHQFRDVHAGVAVRHHNEIVLGR